MVDISSLLTQHPAMFLYDEDTAGSTTAVLVTVPPACRETKQSGTTRKYEETQLFTPPLLHLYNMSPGLGSE